MRSCFAFEIRFSIKQLNSRVLIHLFTISVFQLKKGLIPTPSSNPSISFDIFSVGNALYLAIPFDDDVLIVELNTNFSKEDRMSSNSYKCSRFFLKGHFQYVNASVFRQDVCQVSLANHSLHFSSFSHIVAVAVIYFQRFV